MIMTIIHYTKQSIMAAICIFIVYSFLNGSHNKKELHTSVGILTVQEHWLKKNLILAKRKRLNDLQF